MINGIRMDLYRISSSAIRILPLYGLLQYRNVVFLEGHLIKVSSKDSVVTLYSVIEFP